MDYWLKERKYLIIVEFKLRLRSWNKSNHGSKYLIIVEFKLENRKMQKMLDGSKYLIIVEFKSVTDVVAGFESSVNI